MDTLKSKDRVEHSSDSSIGVGVVMYVDDVAGVRNVGVKWAGAADPKVHPAGQLRKVQELPDKLADVGPGSTVPFQLKVLGRWFEARHELTGEITNQPFDMLPHQVLVAHRVLSSPPAKDGGRHWLIADDVGLGKTIEAGMILEVMRRRAGGSLRCLIVAPASLTGQWQAELRVRFGREFQTFAKTDVNQLESFGQVIASIDTLRLDRFKAALVSVTPWDLVIFDEAHHLTKPGVMRYELAQLLRKKGKARNVLFLTATPHSGNHEHFCHLLHLLRPDRVDPPTRKMKTLHELPLAEMMIRNRKHLVTDAKGNKIFHGIARSLIFSFHPTSAEVDFADEVRDYLKKGYDAAGKLDGQTGAAVGFLMATFGKLASSSREALRRALARRSEVLRGFAEGGEPKESEVSDEDPRAGVSGAVGKGKRGKQSLIDGELDRVDRLLKHLERLPGPDSKLAGFIAEVKKLVAKEPLKLLIFTEYRATLEGVADALEEAFGKGSVATIHGSKKQEERQDIVKHFNTEESPRFLVSTAAGGEGLNMQQRCFTIVNYDLPWNPNVLQQRIGRVYRYGQKKPVVVVNLKVETESDAFADARVYQYLDQKLRTIAETLAKAQGGEGAEDLLGDVLGQAAEQGLSLEELHKQAVEHGAKEAERRINEKAKHVEEILMNPEMMSIFKGLPRFNLEDYKKVEAKVTPEQLGFFVRQYCKHAGATFIQDDNDARRFSFTPTPKLVEIAEGHRKGDPYAAVERIASDKVADATVDKGVAQDGARLLRFGDPVFEAMILHVQFSDFSPVATLDLPADFLGWPERAEGTWVLCELSVSRAEGKRKNILRRELTSFVVPKGGEAAELEGLERVTEAIGGSAQVDVNEARRAHALGRAAGEARLVALLEEVRKEHGGDAALVPEVVDLALAWVRAV
jgi:superfamily II DNA or RNA helicase